MTDPIPLTVAAALPAGRHALFATAPDTPVLDALRDARCMLVEPLPDDQTALPLVAFAPDFVDIAHVPPGTPLYPPTPGVAEPTEYWGLEEPAAVPAASPDHPTHLTEGEATHITYSFEVQQAAALLRGDQSVLVVCDKIVTPHLVEHIVIMANKEPRVLDAEPSPAEDAASGSPTPPNTPNAQTTVRQRLLARLRELIRELKDDQVLVIPHLDLLGGGPDGALSNESRDLVELVYSAADRLILGFVDASLPVPEVLSARFSSRIAMEGTKRVVKHPAENRPMMAQHALITRAEAARFKGLDKTDFHKYMGGLNPVRLRQAMRFATQAHETGDPTVEDLRDTIRTFKAQQSASFEVPNVDWSDIGGYDDVKGHVLRALRLVEESRNLPETDAHLRGELAPKGFIFHGPPGTGKTLFAKAIANKFGATIQIVSGPEVTNKYVGEGERRIRELFAEARRNAPSVVVFDEFDAIAQRRTGWDDGGSRAGNAMVAQILTEMDGFRPDVQMLIIGTTNRLEMIDDALLRPSRFTSFLIGLPDYAARRGIIQVHADRYRVPIDGLLDPLAEVTQDWNGDELRALFRDAYVGARYESEPVGPERLGRLVGAHQLARRNQQLSRRGRT